MTTRRSTRLRIGGTDTPWARTSGTPNARPRRVTSGAPPIASIERSSNEPPTEATRSIHLKVKAPPSKLREVTSGVAVSSRDSLDSAKAGNEPRKSRSKKAIVDESSEDDDEDEDAGGDDDEDEQDEDADGDEDDEDEDVDGDVDMEDAYPSPIHVLPQIKPIIAKPKVTIRRAEAHNSAKSVELKAAEEEDEDEELSEMESQDEDQVDELGEDEDGVEDEEGDEEDAEGDDDIDSEDETPMGSRSGTPDLSKLTRRQRAAYEEMGGGLMALSNGKSLTQMWAKTSTNLVTEAQKKKHLTAEEYAMRRAEMARRRKNLSEKRNEEEKVFHLQLPLYSSSSLSLPHFHHDANNKQMDTINRLLKKQAPKRRGRVKDVSNMSTAGVVAEDGATPGEDSAELERPSALYTRWVNTTVGTILSVPEEWLGTPAGRIFEDGQKTASMGPCRMVEEVQ